MNSYLQDRISKRVNTQARVAKQVSFYRWVSVLSVRNSAGDVAFDYSFDDEMLQRHFFVNGKMAHVEVYRSKVERI